MASFTPQDVHIDAALSSIATAYRNPDEALIGLDVFPRVPVTKQSDKYFTWDKAYWLSIHVLPRAPGSEFPEGLMKLSNDNYFADIFHLMKSIDDEARANEDPAVQLEQSSAEWLSHQFALHREDKLATDIFKTGVWDTDKVGTTDFTKWSDFANSNPIGDIDANQQTIQKNTGRRGNTFVAGRPVHDKLKEHPLLLDKYKHTGTGILSPEQVRDALGVQRYLVGEAVKNTANPTATFTGAYVWDDDALLLWVPSAPGLRVPSAGYTFVWTALPGGGGFDVPIETIRNDFRKRDEVRGMHAFDHKVVGADLGMFFSDAVD